MDGGEHTSYRGRRWGVSLVNYLDCNIAKSDWIQLKEEGIVHTFTIAGWSGKSSLKRLPFVLVYVIVDGCKTANAGLANPSQTSALSSASWSATSGWFAVCAFKIYKKAIAGAIRAVLITEE